jgi:hypothetical protein
MLQNKPIEKDYYLPILNTLKSFGGSGSLDEIRLAVRPLLRASNTYLDADAGKGTSESRFEKDLNWAGKRLGDAGLLRKVRPNWELTEEGRQSHLTAKTLIFLCKLAEENEKRKKRNSSKTIS